jgi:glucosylceramidase
MWSAPAWMKANGSLTGGGYVKPEYYPVLARYQRMAIQAYQAQGIRIHAMTPQNEPLVVQAYPTGQWTGAQMRDYVKNHLGPELWNARVGTEIWVGDDNPPSLRDFVPAILDDPGAAQYVRGVAVHDYSGDEPALLSEFRLRYPGLPLHLTERSYYGVNGEIHQDTGNVQAGVRRVMDFYRNGITSWTYWITFLDHDGEPNTGPLNAACCSVPFSAPPGNLDAYTTNRDYYLYGQFSRYVRHGAERIGSDQTSTEVSNVAFRNPDNSIVVVVANGATAARSVTVRSSDGVLTDTLPALTVATYRWMGGPPPADPRLGTFRLVNQANSGVASGHGRPVRRLPGRVPRRRVPGRLEPRRAAVAAYRRMRAIGVDVLNRFNRHSHRRFTKSPWRYRLVPQPTAGGRQWRLYAEPLSRSLPPWAPHWSPSVSPRHPHPPRRNRPGWTPRCRRTSGPTCWPRP